MLFRTEMSFCSASTSNSTSITKAKQPFFILQSLFLVLLLSISFVFCSFAETSEPVIAGFGTVSTPVTDSSSLFGTGRLTLYDNHESKAQSLSAIIETGEGGLIVVDGGWMYNDKFLLNQIKEKGGHVQAWLLTHPDSDHVGALASILEHYSQEITIDGVYCSLLDDYWYTQFCDDGCRRTVYALRGGLSHLPQEVVHDDIVAGQVIEAGPAKIQVLNSAYALENNTSNNSSVTYLVSLNGTNVVFLGDLSSDGGKRLMKEVDLSSLNCDIVQVAHHGQAGVEYEVYEALHPKIALFPTPKWLWNNDSGSGAGNGGWGTAETRNWMKKLGVNKIYCIKNGDQVIE